MTDRTEGPSAEQEVEHLAGQCATLLRENERLRAVLSDASTNLKLLYMAAGLGQKTGLAALAALNDEITKIDAEVYRVNQQTPQESHDG
jgi:hypothetical protein